MEAKSKMEFNPAGNEKAGMTVIQNDRSAYVMSLMDGKIQLHHFFHGTDSLLASHAYKKSTVFWDISADYLDYDFSYSQDGKSGFYFLIMQMALNLAQNLRDGPIQESTLVFMVHQII
ncbi:MAG TPA: hypothetical protein EYN02_05390 [Candidatus Marinimicrobia bacterium]|nr:hypothetical protein [Candidatus Neomarinimicrobiota bacterium]